MIYPSNFEQKIGFDAVRTILKGRCISTLGTEWVDHQLKFMTSFAEVHEALALAEEFKRFSESEEDVYESNFSTCATRCFASGRSVPTWRN